MKTIHDMELMNETADPKTEQSALKWTFILLMNRDIVLRTRFISKIAMKHKGSHPTQSKRE